MCLLGGGKKIKKLILNWHPICAHSPCSPDFKNIKIISELIWEVPTLEWPFMAQNAPKYKGYGQIFLANLF